jgi:hypothetical protein
MSFRSSRVWIGVTSLSLAGLAACSPLPGVYRAWSGPGWYLEKPYLIVGAGPLYYGGPYTYDKCEEERIRLPAETATQMLCVEENKRPDRYGFF